MGAMRNSVIWAAAVIALVAGCGSGQPAAVTETSTSKAPVPTIKPEVLAEMPHDTSAWTQGLEFDGPTLYEGTGVAGRHSCVNSTRKRALSCAPSRRPTTTTARESRSSATGSGNSPGRTTSPSSGTRPP